MERERTRAGRSARLVLAGLFAGGSDASLLQHANLIGAYVATQYGAVPADQDAAISSGVVPAPRRATR